MESVLQSYSLRELMELIKLGIDRKVSICSK